MSAVTVIGATGRTGHLVVEGALAAGHRVTATARQPDRLADLAERWSASGRLRTAQGDTGDPSSLTAALAGTDVAVCTISAGTRHPGTFMTDSTRAIITALDAARVGRYIAVSSIGAAADDHHPPWWYRKILTPLLLQEVYTDLRAMESLIRAMPNRAWTIVRASRLSDAPARGGYRVADGQDPAGGWRISRHDLAAFIVEHLDDQLWTHRTPSLAY